MIKKSVRLYHCAARYQLLYKWKFSKSDNYAIDHQMPIHSALGTETYFINDCVMRHILLYDHTPGAFINCFLLIMLDYYIELSLLRLVTFIL